MVGDIQQRGTGTAGRSGKGAAEASDRRRGVALRVTSRSAPRGQDFPCFVPFGPQRLEIFVKCSLGG